MDSKKFFNALTNEFKKLELPANDYSGMLYHYTSPDGLMGILNEKAPVLWFTRADCVNDPTEGHYMIAFYKNICEELLQNKDIDLAFYNSISDIKPNSKIYYCSINKERWLKRPKSESTFICCFSQARDSLPMWNYYVKNDRYQGYCIGLFNSIFRKLQDASIKEDSGMRFELKEVQYCNNEYRNSFAAAVKRLFKLWDNSATADDKTNIQEMIKLWLTEWQWLVKPNCYSHEKEVRAIIHMPDDIPELRNKINIKYRSSHGYIIPYIEPSISEHEKGAFEEIIIGPLAEKEISKSTIQSYISSYGYNRISVSNSIIPIRCI